MALSLEQLLVQRADPMYYFCFPLLPKGGRMVIGAPPKHFKSMLALNIAYDLAEGGKVFDSYEVKRPLSVLYVEKEIGQHRVKERMERIHQWRNGDVAPGNLHFLCKGNGCSLDTDFGKEALVREIEAVKPDVIVLDPLRKFHTSDEDSSTEMVKVFKALDEIQEQHDVTAILLHHAAKRSEFRDGSNPESLRGSSEIYADGDTYIMLDKPIKGNDKTIRLHFSLRSAADPKPLMLRFNDETYSFERVVNAPASGGVRG